MSRAVAPLSRRLSRRLSARLGALVATGALTVGTLTAVTAVTATDQAADGAVSRTAARATTNPVTPGDFTGYGFDQCLAPSQATMDRWLRSSPFLAVGIYISGYSRACRSQPNLTPTWVARQLARGWRLLPITLGPQASCQPRFPRYGSDKRINPDPGDDGLYRKARTMGTNEATTTVAAAKALGIVPRSTLWYDLEGFDATNTRCRESALAFLSAWTTRIRALGYVSGVYSSAGSGIKVLDDARVNRPGKFALPDQIWLARWDGVANTSTSYLRSDGWMPTARVKQYMGGHDEKWGGVTVNIDRNFLNVGRGSLPVAESHCGGVQMNLSSYPGLRAPRTTPLSSVKVLQCLLKEKGLYRGKVNGVFGTTTLKALDAYRTARHWKNVPSIGRRAWVSLLASGDRKTLKYGSTGPLVSRVQRALKAAKAGKGAAALRVTGVFDASTTVALKEWQRKVKVEASGVTSVPTWAKLEAGAS